MPLDTFAFQALFAGAAKPYQEYIDRFAGRARLYALFQSCGQANFSKFIQAFYPAQLHSLKVGLTSIELNQIANMTQGTLNSLREVNATWIKEILRIIANVRPTTSVQVAPNTLGLTQDHPGLKNHLVTEVQAANQLSPRNLIFNGIGVCVAEINFANHGGTATSGHAHVYPVWAMPITGHHMSGVPHFGLGDYPAQWRALPAGINPRTGLWT